MKVSEQFKNTSKEEKALRETEEHLRLFIASSSNLVYRMSADWSRMETLVGKELLADTPEPITDWIDKYILVEDQPHVLAVIHKAITNKTVFELEHRVKLADGSVGWVHSRATPLLDEQGEIIQWFGTGSDITGRRKIEESLQKSEEKYRTIFETIDEGFCIFELIYENGKAIDLRWVEVNPAYEKQTGLKDTVGQLVSEVMPGIERNWLEIYEITTKTGEAVHFENWHEPTNRWYYVFASRFGGANSRQVAALFSDITERKRRELSTALLEQITNDLVTLTRPDEMIQTVGARIGEFMQVATCLFQDVDEERNEVTVHFAWSLDGLPDLKQTFKLSNYLSEEFNATNRAGQAFVVNDVNTDKRTDSNAYAKLKIGAFVTVPFHWQGQWAGFISITHVQPRVWRKDEIELLREVTNRLFFRIERARAEEALQKSEERLRLSIKIGDLLTWEIDPQTSDIKYSNNCSEVIGFEISNNSDENFIYVHPDDADFVGAAVEKALKAEMSLDIEHRLIHPHTREIVWVRAQGQLTERSDAKTVFIGITQNITKRKQVEEALRESESQLKQLLKMRDEFIGIASHELKTPVTSMKAYAEIAQQRVEEIGNSDDSDLLTKLNTQLDRLTKLINSLLDTTKISEGKLLLNIEELNINELLNERVEEIRRTTRHKFELNLQDLPLITADRERIIQVVTNLLSNAIKYSPRGTTITVKSAAEQSGIKVSVEDEGYGIPEQDIPKIFHRFFRVTANNMDTFPGMGLGLYITDQIIHKHKGIMGVQSTVGKGSVFSFTLPFNNIQRS